MANESSKSRPLTQIEKWVNRLNWLDGCDVLTELYQAEQEGRELGPLRQEILDLQAVPSTSPRWEIMMGGERDEAWLARCGAAVDKVQTLPIRPDFPYKEPSDLPGIHAARPTENLTPTFPYTAGEEAFAKQLHGGLLGRLCACLLGKPVELFDRASIKTVGEATGNWPINNYWSRPNETQMKAITAAAPRHMPKTFLTGQFLGEIQHMVIDDDVNYTLIGFEVVRQFGADFEPQDVAYTWLTHLSLTQTCTAERVAYRNFLAGVIPPLSATTRNPYREWIGAQIRADYFGYANPGNPQRAAEWAWRDASISHVSNGIYGEMWVAAMIAAAYVLKDWTAVIRAGLDQIPVHCRLRIDVEKILTLHKAGATWEEATDSIHAQWNELLNHDWCHTNSNAQVVAMALLWGNDDYETTITRSIMAGFDTDCNGATTGSLWGTMHGVDAIPAKWSTPLNDSGISTIGQWRHYTISNLAQKMTETALKNGASVSAK